MTKKLKIFATTVEDTARAQIDEMNECEAYRDCTVRIMPDCHAGKGCTIGTVIEVKDRIVPNTVHNYIDTCSMILRKGAVDAWSGLLIIPMNMRDGSLLCKGLDNPDWLWSAPHGAGRLMSRKQAFDTLRMQDFTDTMSDIYSTSVCPETIDESPMAYKPMQEIIGQIGDTVEIIDIIKPIYNFKAKNGR